MTKYIPEVGDAIKFVTSEKIFYVTAVGNSSFLYSLDGEQEYMRPFNNVLYAKVNLIGEAWANDYGVHISSWYASLRLAEEEYSASPSKRIGIIYRDQLGSYHNILEDENES